MLMKSIDGVLSKTVRVGSIACSSSFAGAVLSDKISGVYTCKRCLSADLVPKTWDVNADGVISKKKR